MPELLRPYQRRGVEWILRFSFDLARKRLKETTS